MNNNLLKLKSFNLPLLLVLIIVISIFFGNYISADVKSFFYAISLTIKEILIFILPFIIFSYLFSCIISLSHGAIKFIFFVLSAVIISNFSASIIGYLTSITAQNLMNIEEIKQISSNAALIPAWEFKLNKLIPNDMALFSGILLGLIFSYMKSSYAEVISNKLKEISTFILNKIFIPIVPIFILGFIFKLQYEGNLLITIAEYGKIFIIIFTVQCLYIAFLFGVSVNFNFNNWLVSLKNILPSAIVGFSTMSSAAAMPLTIKGSELNSINANLVRVLIPTTTNIHLIGCSIFIPVMAIAIMQTNGIVFPDFVTYMLFAFYFVIAKFAVAAVPAGGVLVMIPVLESQFGFNSDMSSMITALYIMFDAFITTINILGNAAFASVFTKFYSKISIIKEKHN